MRFKNNIFINCGIEISNYEKALNLIKEQIEAMKKGDFSDEDIKNAKKNIISTIRLIEDEQDTGLAYYFGQELAKTNMTPEKYMKRIESTKKDDIVNVANKVSINTIYFLKD